MKNFDKFPQTYDEALALINDDDDASPDLKNLDRSLWMIQICGACKSHDCTPEELTPTQILDTFGLFLEARIKSLTRICEGG